MGLDGGRPVGRVRVEGVEEVVLDSSKEGGISKGRGGEEEEEGGIGAGG